MTKRPAIERRQEDDAFFILERYTRALATAMGYRDLMTRLHSQRVVGLAAAMGARLGLGGPDMQALAIAASFHDIGKIGVPDHILMKPSRLDADESRTIRQHSVMGEDILLATGLTGALLPAIAIRHHHEHFDGSGYPDGLAGADIPLFSRIIGIADSYDAMAVTRSYHAAKPHSEIMAILRAETEAKHDPELMWIFSRVIEESPLRTRDTPRKRRGARNIA